MEHLEPDIDYGTAVAEHPAPDTQRPKRNCLIQIFAIMIAGGFMQGILPEDSNFSLIEIVTIVLFTLMAMRWCYIDADERNFTISFRLSLLLFLLFLAGFPYYILKTRRNLDALIVMGVTFLIFVLASVLNEAAYALGVAIYNARL